MNATVRLRRAYRPGETIVAQRRASVPILAKTPAGLRVNLSAAPLPPVFQHLRVEPEMILVPVAMTLPAIVPGAADVKPESIVALGTLGAPKVMAGAVGIEPTLADVAVVVTSPRVQAGMVELRTETVNATAVAPTPTVQPGLVELRPSAVGSSAVISPPSVQPGPATVASSALKPTVAVPRPAVTTVESSFFSDEFDGAAGAPLGERTGWLSVGGTGSLALTGTGELDANNPNNSGASYTSPDIGTVDHWVEAVIAVGASAVPGPAIACRLFNANNHVGVRWSTAGFELYSRTNGTITILATNALVPKAGDVIRLTVKGPQGTALLNGAPLFAATVPETARTTQGLVARGAVVTPFIRSYRAGAA